MQEFCLFNGEIKSTKAPLLKPNDLAVLRGYGIFDFMPVKESIPIFYEDYWKRFSRSAKLMDLPLPYPADQLYELLQELFHRNRLTEGYCKLVLTGGYSSGGFLPDGEPNLLILTSGVVHVPEEQYTTGIKLISVNYVRDLPQVKSLNYSRALIEQRHLKSENAQDILYRFDGKISESSRANFFIVNHDEVLKTAGNHILEGITRSKILEIAKLRMQVSVEDFGMDEIRTAKAAFISSTTKAAMPVRQIDDIVINGGKIHPIIGELKEELRVLVRQYLDARK